MNEHDKDLFKFQVTEWRTQCENAQVLLQTKDQKGINQAVDVTDGLPQLTKGKTDKKSPKFFNLVVGRLVTGTNRKKS